TTAPLVGEKVHVTSSVSDPDSSCAGFKAARVFRWSLPLRPPGSAAALEDPTARAGDFTPDVPGSYQAQLVVTDATGLSSAPALFTVQTSPCGNAPPRITTANATCLSPNPGETVQLFAQTFDPDNSGLCNLQQTATLRWAVVTRPAGSSAVLTD